MRRKGVKIGFLCLILLVALGFALPLQSNDIVNSANNVITDSTSYIALSDLKEEYNNPNIVGAIRISGTDISEILVQGEDNDYYLNHNIYNESDVKGATFLDYRVTLDSSKILIYGHNSDSLNVPFRELENYYDEEYYHDHKIIEIITESGIKRYEIFSVYVETRDWNYMTINFDNQDSWYNHIKELKEKSWYDTGVDVSEYDEILILQTCSHYNDFKNYDRKYLLIIARGI